MRKLPVFVLFLLATWTSDARALDIKNVRSNYGPFGVPRSNNKVLPGEVYFINFDITDMSVDPKTGGVEYTLTLEVFDPKGKQMIPDKEKSWMKGAIVGLGGTTVPEFTNVVIGVDKDPGKYKVVITVEEKNTKAKASVTQELEVLPSEFGFIHVQAPAIGQVGQDYVCEFSLVGWQRDSKKIPKITLATRIIDDATGKPATTLPNISKIPEDLPKDIDWPKLEMVRMRSPTFLNRPGTFTIEFEAKDELKNKTAKFSYKLVVIQPTGK
jgi:hypothetical protein